MALRGYTEIIMGFGIIKGLGGVKGEKIGVSIRRGGIFWRDCAGVDRVCI